MTYDVAHLFIWWFAIYVSSLVRYLVGEVFSGPFLSHLCLFINGVVIRNLCLLWIHALMLRCFCRVSLFVIPWTAACQAPLSTGFSKQEHWSGLPCPPSGDLCVPGIEPTSLTSPALAGGFLITTVTWEAPIFWIQAPNQICGLGMFSPLPFVIFLVS